MSDRLVSATFRTSVVLPSASRCSQCVERLCSAVESLPGVSASECDARASQITIRYDPSAVDADELERRVIDLGLDVASGVEHAAYRVAHLD